MHLKTCENLNSNRSRKVSVVATLLEKFWKRASTATPCPIRKYTMRITSAPRRSWQASVAPSCKCTLWWKLWWSDTDTKSNTTTTGFRRHLMHLKPNLLLNWYWSKTLFLSCSTTSTQTKIWQLSLRSRLVTCCRALVSITTPTGSMT